MHTATILLPGVNPESLIRTAMDRIRQLESEVRRLQQQASTADQCLCVYQTGRLINVPIADILYIKSESNYSRIFLIQGEQYYTSRTLKSWLEEIPASGFLRCHRSFLINKKEIAEIDKHKKEIKLKGGMRIPVSRRTQSNSVSVLFLEQIQDEVLGRYKPKCAVHKLLSAHV